MDNNDKELEHSYHSDTINSTMYGALLGMARTEIQVVWTRYSGFLIIQGLIFSFLQGQLFEKGNWKLLLTIGILGIVISIVWFVLNYAGWFNQNVYLYKASQIRFKSLDISLPTDWINHQPSKKPTGIIYHIAQGVSIAFLLLYDLTVCLGIYQLKVTLPQLVIYYFIIMVICITCIYLIVNQEFNKRKKKLGNRDIA